MEERLDPRRLHELMHRPDQERMVPTFQMRRRPSEVRTVVSRLVVPIALLVSTGIVIGAYIAFGDRGKAHDEIAATGEPSTSPPTTTATTTTTAPAAPPAPASAPLPAAPAPAVVAQVAAPAAAPVAEAAPAAPPPASVAAPAAADTDVAAPPPATLAAAAPAPARLAAAAAIAAPATAAAGAPSLVDVRIESIPSGATVTLVDRGRTQLVGDTPIDTAVDPARAYDLVFTYADRPPHVEHLDARATRRISAMLDAREPSAMPVDPSPRHAERSGREPAASRPSRTRAEAGQGTLMISSKPPCEIVIDGRSTGLTTPQRSIALPAGHHRITLLDSEKSIQKTLTVQIAANTTERVIEDLMK